MPHKSKDARRTYERLRMAGRPGERKARHLKHRYGLTPAAWLAMHHLQGGRCATCRAPLAGGGNIDHDHATGQVRGILCHWCNKTLGLLGDTAAMILYNCGRYLAYLQGPSCRFSSKD